MCITQMIMKEELKVIVRLINDGLSYKSQTDNELDIYGDTFTAAGITEQNLIWGISELSRKGIITAHLLRYEREKPESTHSRVNFTTSSHQRAVYTFTIDRQKLAELKPESMSGKLPVFDAPKGNIVIGDIVCHIAETGDYQHHICKELLTAEPDRKYKIGDWVSETYLQDTYSLPLTGESLPFKSSRWVKDATYKINEKVQDYFSIKKFVDYRKSNVRIVTENFR